MQRIAPFLILLSWCPLVFGQSVSNSITVTASNTATLQPDQAIFSVTVQAGLNTTLDEVVAALAGSGITAANFSGISTPPVLCSGQLPCPSSLPTAVDWIFSLPAPLTNTAATIASLTALQQNIAKANNGLMLSFYIVGTQVSQQLAQSQTCSIPNLITSATTQAQALAASGGVSLGAILAMSSSISNVAGTSPANPYASATPAPCAITVKFNVTRY